MKIPLNFRTIGHFTISFVFSDVTFFYDTAILLILRNRKIYKSLNLLQGVTAMHIYTSIDVHSSLLHPVVSDDLTKSSMSIKNKFLSFRHRADF